MLAFTLILSMISSPQPAQFVFIVETNTKVSVFVGDMQIEPGMVYQIAPFVGFKSVIFTVKFVDGDITVTKTGILTLQAGKVRQITIKVFARPPTIVTV